MSPKKPVPTELSTVGMDPRFPNQNQTLTCFSNYVNYHRCKKMKGEAFDKCNYFKRALQVFCPNDWVKRWDEQQKDGTFPGKF